MSILGPCQDDLRLKTMHFGSTLAIVPDGYFDLLTKNAVVLKVIFGIGNFLGPPGRPIKIFTTCYENHGRQKGNSINGPQY